MKVVSANKKAERNRKIVRQYRRDGLTLKEIAERHGISESRVSYILKAENARLPMAQLVARYRENFKRPSPGRPRHYADDPEKRERYLELRKHFSADEVHTMLSEEGNA